MPKPTTHITDYIAMRVQPMQQIADFMVRSQPNLSETLSSMDREITAVKWRLWHEVEQQFKALQRRSSE